MTVMARRTLSVRGRVIAAATCVGLAGLLAGLMAATDDTGSASAGTPSSGSSSATVPGTRVGDDGSSSGTHARTPDGFDGFDNGSGAQSGSGSQPTFPQPHTRSGGS